MTPPESRRGAYLHSVNTADAPGVCKGEGGKGVYQSPDDDSDGRAGPAHDMDWISCVVRSGFKAQC